MSRKLETTKALMAALVLSLLVPALAHAQDADKAARFAAMKECRTSANMPSRDSGQRPTKEQFQAFRECLKAKDFTGHSGGGHWQHREMQAQPNGAQ